MTQYARPNSDTATGAWVPSTGASLFECINEAFYSETDYVTNSGTSSTFECTLNSVTDPNGNTNHTINVRAWRASSGASCTGYLMEGTTQRASFTVTVSSSHQTTTYTLSSAEADSITDYSNLRLKFTGVKSVIACAELSVPSPTYSEATALNASGASGFGQTLSYTSIANFLAQSGLGANPAGSNYGVALALAVQALFAGKYPTTPNIGAFEGSVNLYIETLTLIAQALLTAAPATHPDIGAFEYVAGSGVFNEVVALSASGSAGTVAQADLLGILQLPASAVFGVASKADFLAAAILAANAAKTASAYSDLQNAISLQTAAVAAALNSLLISAGVSLASSAGIIGAAASHPDIGAFEYQGGNVYNESVSLAVYGSDGLGSGAVFNPGVLVTSLAAMSAAVQNSLLASSLLQASAGLLNTGGLTCGDAVILGTAAAIAGLASALIPLGATLAASSGLAINAQNVLAVAATLAANGAITPSTQANLLSALTLAANSGLSASDQMALAVAVTLAALAGFDVLGEIGSSTYNELVDLVAQASVSRQAQQIFEALTILATQGDVSGSSQALLESALILLTTASLGTDGEIPGGPQLADVLITLLRRRRGCR